MTMWQRMKRYINVKHQIGDIITRKEMLYYLYQGPPPKTSSYGTGGDNYKRCLTKLGILETVKRGQYKILYHIKDGVTSSQVKELAYSNSWKEWFIDIKVGDSVCEEKL